MVAIDRSHEADTEQITGRCQGAEEGLTDLSTHVLTLVRLRQGVCGEAGRSVHLVSLSKDAEASGVVGTLCAMSLVADQVEVVAPGVGMPCTRCLLHRDRTTPQPILSAGTYREWGWPVSVGGNQVLLTLGLEVTALVLPDGLAEAVTAVLTGRDHPVPVLVDPGAPEDWVLLAGEPYGVELPWPLTVRQRTGTLALPPSLTALGPVAWRRAPTGPDLAGCREIDVFSAVRTVLRAAAHTQGAGS